jgi:hypothetical protein
MSVLGGITAGSLFGVNVAGTVRRSSQSTLQSNGTSVGPNGDGASFSAMVQLVGKLWALRQQDPAKFKQAMSQIASQFQASPSGDTTQNLFGSILHQLNQTASH